MRSGFTTFWTSLPRFTTSGFYFSAMTVVMAVIAWNRQNNLLYLLFTLMVSLLVVCAVLSFLTMARITVRRRIPFPVFAHEPFRVRIDIANGKLVLPSYLISIEDTVFEARSGHRPREFMTFSLGVGAGSTGHVEYTVELRNRGKARFTEMTVKTDFPFGFFRCCRSFVQQEEMLVFPRLGSVSRDIYRSQTPMLSFSSVRVTGGLGDEEFVGLREFRPGDNPKRIHWKSSARIFPELLVKEFEDALVRRVVVIADTSLAALPRRRREKLIEQVASFTASLGHDLSRNGYDAEFCLCGATTEVVDVQAGSGGLFRLFESLALAQPGSAGAFEGALETIAPKAAFNAVVVIVGAELICRRDTPGAALVDVGAPRFQCLFSTGEPVEDPVPVV
jgi:uncharacterized protein (DUF58 family)